MGGVPQKAVIVDQWSLVRLGIGAVLRAGDIRVVGEESRAQDALMRARDEEPDLIVFGSHLDVPVAEAVRLAAALTHLPRILVLLNTATRDDLAALFTAGADGALLRSVTGNDLSEAVTRLLAGDRVLAPAFVPVLAGTMAAASDGDSDAENALTAKEREVLTLLAQGQTNREIADALFISSATVKTHLAHLYEKLGVGDRRAAIAHAVAEGLLS
jgi:DNA-binding NarL/FixJ family response regulator